MILLIINIDNADNYTTAEMSSGFRYSYSVVQSPTLGYLVIKYILHKVPASALVHVYKVDIYQSLK